MRTFLLVAVSNESIEQKFEEKNRCKLDDGVWFVRSDKSTSHEVSEFMGFSTTNIGIVVTAEHMTGWGPSSVTEKINRWITSG